MFGSKLRQTLAFMITFVLRLGFQGLLQSTNASIKILKFIEGDVFVVQIHFRLGLNVEVSLQNDMFSALLEIIFIENQVTFQKKFCNSYVSCLK